MADKQAGRMDFRVEEGAEKKLIRDVAASRYAPKSLLRVGFS